ncbi:MAG: hypothetical protein R3D27_09825 [Hyphomicrobiaceae bacterium]
MQLGLTLSVLLHALLLGWAFVSFAKTQPMKLPEPEPVAVAIISEDELVRLRKGDRDSKNLEVAPAKKPDAEPTKTEAPKPTPRAAKPPAAAEPPPPPPPQKTAEPPPPPAADPIASKLAALQKEPPPPPPGPSPEELKRIEDEKKAEAERSAEDAKKRAEQQKAEEAERKKKELAEKKRKEDERRKKLAEQRRKEAERRRKIAEAKKAEEERKRKQFDPGRLAALLNKIPDKPQPAAGSEAPSTKPLPKGPQAGAPEGKDTRLTASQRSMIGMMMRDAVKTCWRVQTGLEGANQLVVDVEVRLRPDGSIDGQPRVVSHGSGPLYADASNRAISALMGCAPYAMLPKEFYKGGWDFMVVTFDPKKMF